MGVPNKLTLEQIKEIRNSNLTNAELARKFNVSEATISYWRNDEIKEKKRQRAKEYYLANKDKFIERHKKWKKNNYFAYRKSITISLIKSALKKGYITEQDIVDALSNFRKWRSENESW